MKIAQSILKILPEKRSGLAMNILGFLVGIPVFCDAAFVVLSSLNKELHQKTGLNFAGLTVSLSSGLFASHVLVPPTPGPLAAASNFELQNLAGLIFGGAALALIISLVGWLSSKNIKTELTLNGPRETPIYDKIPSFLLSIAPIFLPLFFMALGILSPTFSLLLGVLPILLMVKEKSKWLEEGFKQAAPILFITAMGGTLGLMMRELPLAEMFKDLQGFKGPGLLIPFLIASFFKIAQGSSTVSIITTSALFFPLMDVFGFEGEIDKIWIILSIGVGSMTVSHANDSYFWIVAQMSGMDIKTALKTHTLTTFIQGIVGILILIVSYHIYSLF
jgi:GntP family gluconate:H+ symporter